MLGHLASLALRSASPSRLSVLIYHRVQVAPDPLLPNEPTDAEFERTMRWVRDTFNVIPLADAVAGLKSGKLPARALAITFDDGYANNESVAAPILSRLGLHATFFIATGFLDGGRMFNDTIIEAVRATRNAELDLQAIGLGRHAVGSDADRVRTISVLIDTLRRRPVEERVELSELAAQQSGARLPADLMMTSAQAAGLARAGFALGGHTVRHPILAGLPAEAARREIFECKRRIEEVAGSRVTLFAYPNGRPNRDYVSATVELVKAAGFEGAVSTSSGAARFGSDPYQIPRFTPWDQRMPAFAVRMWSNLARAKPDYAAA